MVQPRHDRPRWQSSNTDRIVATHTTTLSRAKRLGLRRRLSRSDISKLSSTNTCTNVTHGSRRTGTRSSSRCTVYPLNQYFLDSHDGVQGYWMAERCERSSATITNKDDRRRGRYIPSEKRNAVHGFVRERHDTGAVESRQNTVFSFIRLTRQFDHRKATIYRVLTRTERSENVELLITQINRD